MLVLEIDADKRFRNAVDRALKTTDDLRVPFGLIAGDFYRSQRPIFQMSGPGPYPDLNKAYKKHKQTKFGRIYPILKANGYLAAAASIQGASGNITEIGAKNMTLGVDSGTITYADYHNSDRPRRKIPLRKFLFLGNGDDRGFANPDQLGRVDRWVGILNEFVLQKLKESGMGEIS